jgi:hypothetical protein
MDVCVRAASAGHLARSSSEAIHYGAVGTRLLLWGIRRTHPPKLTSFMHTCKRKTNDTQSQAQWDCGPGVSILTLAHCARVGEVDSPGARLPEPLRLIVIEGILVFNLLDAAKGLSEAQSHRAREGGTRTVGHGFP